MDENVRHAFCEGYTEAAYLPAQRLDNSSILDHRNLCNGCKDVMSKCISIFAMTEEEREKIWKLRSYFRSAQTNVREKEKKKNSGAADPPFGAIGVPGPQPPSFWPTAQQVPLAQFGDYSIRHTLIIAENKFWRCHLKMIVYCVLLCVFLMEGPSAKSNVVRWVSIWHAANKFR